MTSARSVYKMRIEQMKEKIPFYRLLLNGQSGNDKVAY